MRKNIVVTGFTIAALVAAGGAPVYAQNTTGEKIEKKTDETKDKAVDPHICAVGRAPASLADRRRRWR